MNKEDRDFYPFNIEDLDRKEFSFKGFNNHDYLGFGIPPLQPRLISLAGELLTDAEKIKNLTVRLESGEISNQVAFLETLKHWIESNADGVSGVNFYDLISPCRNNNLGDFSLYLEDILALYKLPIKNNVENSDGEVCERKCYVFHGKDSNVEVSEMSLYFQDMALKNGVILEEIFKNLLFLNRADFRLVNPLWKEETLALWRRSSRLKIKIKSIPDVDEKVFYNSVFMEQFLDILDKERKQDQECIEKAGSDEAFNSFKLLKYPFKSYSISYKDCPRVIIGERENTFLELCGPHVENLRLCKTIFKDGPGTQIDYIFKELIKSCKNLKELEFADSCEDNNFEFDMISDEESDEDGDNEGQSKDNVERKTTTVLAEKLTSLHFNFLTNSYKAMRIMELCPNLKTLSVRSERIFHSVLDLAANGKPCQLETLKFTEKERRLKPRFFRDILTSLSTTLKNLYVKDLCLYLVRRSPFYYYEAISNCSSYVNSLHLEFVFRGQRGRADVWFFDLSLFSFPNLTKFEILFKDPRDSKEEDELMKFDFSTLRSMPKLQELTVMTTIDSERVAPRLPGTGDWIYNGNLPRNKYLPEKLKAIRRPPTEGPIQCLDLKKFRFLGWDLNKEDVELMSSWFPNLTHLRAPISRDALPTLINHWGKLEKLRLRSSSFVHLSELLPLKERNNELQILVQLCRSDQLLKVTQTMEHLSFEVVDDESGEIDDSCMKD